MPASGRARDLVPVGRWSCRRSGCAESKHVELRTMVAPRTGEIVEIFTYACGHTSRRVVGQVLPSHHFAAIEARICADADRERRILTLERNAGVLAAYG